MSGHIKSIFICPRCEEGITSIETTVNCPNCGLPLGKQPVDAYALPYTLHEQHLKYLNAERLIHTLSSMPIEKANNIANDALLVIENIAGKMTRIEDIRILVGLCIRIGKVAEAYEKFLEAGGKHHPTHHIKQQQDQETQNEPKDRVVEIPPPAPSGDGRRGS